MNPSILNIKERVIKGVNLLDETVPDWRSRIDLDRFDMSHPDNCVLGQIGGDNIFKGCRMIGLDKNEDLMSHGFEHSFLNLKFKDNVWKEVKDEFLWLTQEWTNHIKRRI